MRKYWHGWTRLEEKMREKEERQKGRWCTNTVSKRPRKNLITPLIASEDEIFVCGHTEGVGRSEREGVGGSGKEGREEAKAQDDEEAITFHWITSQTVLLTCIPSKQDKTNGCEWSVTLDLTGPREEWSTEDSPTPRTSDKSGKSYLVSSISQAGRRRRSRQWFERGNRPGKVTLRMREDFPIFCHAKIIRRQLNGCLPANSACIYSWLRNEGAGISAPAWHAGTRAPFASLKWMLRTAPLLQISSKHWPDCRIRNSGRTCERRDFAELTRSCDSACATYFLPITVNSVARSQGSSNMLQSHIFSCSFVSFRLEVTHVCLQRDSSWFLWITRNLH